MAAMRIARMLMAGRPCKDGASGWRGGAGRAAGAS
jgi:hypothetical protein